MITYNPKDWFSLIVTFHKGDTFRQLIPVMIALGLLATGIVYVERNVFELHFKNTTVIHSILGFVLSLLLVFRTNTAYDRWWEGRKQWGAMVNNSRNLALKWESYLPLHEKTRREEMRHLIINYVYCLKNHLRGTFDEKEWVPLNCLSLEELKSVQHKPNRIATEMYRLSNSLHQSGLLSDVQMRNLDPELRAFTDILGACERIKRTPIPYSYSLFLKKIIFIYTITMPLAFCMDFGYASVPISMLVLYVFASIELIAEEIEDPFGEDDNDLPTDDICKRIKDNLEEIIN